MTTIVEGWLLKDGNTLIGSWKNRYCSLTYDDGAFSLDYFEDEHKIQKKGTFNIDRDSGFRRLPDIHGQRYCFSVNIASGRETVAATRRGSMIGGARKAGETVTFSAPSSESFEIWEASFRDARAPVVSNPGAAVKSYAKPEMMVIGSSGSVGQATVKALANYAEDVSIKAGVRDVSSVKNAPLTLEGVKLVSADLNRPDLLPQELAGVQVAFIVTPGHVDRTNLTVTGIKACAGAGVGHIVVLSVCSVVKTETTFAKQFIPIEEAVAEAGVPYTIVRLPMFMDNILGQLENVAVKGEFYTPLEQGKTMNHVVVDDIGAAVAKIMTSAAHYQYKTLTLSASSLTTNEEMASAFSKVSQRACKHVTVNYKDAKESMLHGGMPEWQANGVIELYKLANSGDPCMTTVTSDLPTVLGRGSTGPMKIAAEALERLGELKRAHEEKLANLAASERAEKELALMEAAAKALEAAKSMVINGGLVLKKMGNESGYKDRFVWIDDDDKKVCWSKSETKEAQFKFIQLAPEVKVTEPVFSAAKPAAMFGVAETDGYTFSVVDKDPASPSLDLKIAGPREHAEAWIKELNIMCGRSVKTSKTVIPDSMRGVVYDFAKKSFQFKSGIPTPVPVVGEALISVKYASINPVESKVDLWSGLVEPMNQANFVMGVDVAGTIEQIFEDGSPFSVGDRVVCHPWLPNGKGSYANYCICSTSHLVKIPDEVSFEAAATTPVAGWTAYKAVMKKMRVQAGQGIFITGGNGGLGGFCIQLAKLAGCYPIITTCSEANHERVTSLGATHWIDYKIGNAKIVDQIGAITNGKGVTYIVDGIGSASAKALSQCLTFDGEICCVAGVMPRTLDEAYFKGITVHDVALAPPAYLSREGPPKWRELGNAMMKLLAEKKLDPMVGRRITLAEAAQELNKPKPGNGKLVVIVSG
mmetsp:Transcript_30622/g.51739  ORF Transcript_30622/g.51739 Transcript_30622/m.51739 type:complete len:927 (+) Transcript_30622:81-2861(+)